jgi:hypothetical protein
MTDPMTEIRATLEARVDEPIEQYGFFMSKGSFTKLPPGVTSGAMKMLGGLKRKKNAGDLSATTTNQAVWGLDNHQSAIVVTATRVYAIDTTTSMSRTMTVGEVLSSWPREELCITGTAKKQGRDVMLLALDIRHEPSGQGGQLETMAYTNVGDPSWDCYQTLVSA